jgi:hypothetical protein
VVTRFCNKSPNVPAPSVYFAFGDANKINAELATDRCDQLFHPTFNHQTSSSNIESDDDSETETVFVNTSEYDEKYVSFDSYESILGTNYDDIGVNNASFVVASNPLSNTHTWHAMPKNSIMWHQRGSLPELQLLRPASSSSSSSPSKKRPKVAKIKETVTVEKELDKKSFKTAQPIIATHGLLVVEQYHRWNGFKFIRGSTRFPQRLCINCSRKVRTYCKCNPHRAMCQPCHSQHIVDLHIQEVQSDVDIE